MQIPGHKAPAFASRSGNDVVPEPVDRRAVLFAAESVHFSSANALAFASACARVMETVAAEYAGSR